METESPKTRKKETAQEAYKNLREKNKIEMLDRMQKIEDAQERAIAAKADKMKKKDKGKEHEESPRKVHIIERRDNHPKLLGTSPARPISATAPFPIEPTPMITKPEHAAHAERTKIVGIETQQRHRRRRGRCTNCCGGLPGQGPGSNHGGGGHCCCASGNRTRGGSDTDRSLRENYERTQARSSSENSRTPRRLCDHHCGHSSKMSFMRKDLESFCSGWDAQFDSFPIRGDKQRERGGCGGCGAPSPCCRPCPPPPPKCQKPTHSRCNETKNPSTKACCPCGGCGGAACSDNPGGGGKEGGCCGGNRPKGLPCKCKCQSCDTFRPLGGCGGQSCGKIYSCAGSSGGKCCFPRNTKRRSGPDCCGGANSNCGGCC